MADPSPQPTTPQKTPRKQTRLPEILEQEQGAKSPNDVKTPTFTQRLGKKWGYIVLWSIVGSALAVWFAWYITRPDLNSVRASLQITGDTLHAKELVDYCKALQTEHFNHYRTLSELLIGAVFVPLFTLLVGYALGVEGKKQ